jgi:type II secretory pathway pseudopilin PulG
MRRSGTRERTGFLGLARAGSRGEGGFSLVETVVAIGTIFVSLTALAYTGVAGFGYISLARERQAANQIADKLMEEVRGLAFAKVQQGIPLSAVAGDTRIKRCTEPEGTVYRFLSCLPVPSGSPPGTGEKVTYTDLDCSAANSPCAAPLSPNAGTFPRSSGYPVTYSYRTYVTNDDPSKDPYRVTVVVSWTGGSVGGVARYVQDQSLFWSPVGCTSAGTHPFSAPCQPFFYSQAVASQGRIDITKPEDGVGLYQDPGFTQASLLTTYAESDLQVEQVAQVQGSFRQTGLSLTDANGTVERSGGSTAAADGDPSGGADPYSVVPATGEFLGSAWAPLTTGTAAALTLSNTAGDPAQAIGAVAAGPSSVCPPSPPAPPAQTDGQPCGGVRVRQAGALSAVATLNGVGPALGDFVLVRVAGVEQGSDTTTFVDRVPVTAADGNAEQAVSRALGEVDVGGLPTAFAPPGWDGYFIRLTGYSDSVRSAVGTSASEPSADVAAGTLLVYDGSGYAQLSGTDAVSITTPITLQTQVGSHWVSVLFSGSAAGATPSVSGQDPPGIAPRTSAQAAVTPPLAGTFRYQVLVDSVPVLDVEIAVDLGAISAEGTYQPPPAAGS